MPGFQSGFMPKPRMSSGRPPTPIVNRALVQPQKPVTPLPLERQLEPLSKCPLVGEVLSVVSVITGFTEAELCSTTRGKRIAAARQLLYWATRRWTNKALLHISRGVGGRDHTTIRHGVRKVQAVAESIPAPAGQGAEPWLRAIWAVWEAEWERHRRDVLARRREGYAARNEHRRKARDGSSKARLADHIGSSGDDAARRAWEAYCAAAEKAQHTPRLLQDGIAAGKAWKAFLDLFLVKSER